MKVLTQEQLDYFHDQGYLVVEDVFESRSGFRGPQAGIQSTSSTSPPQKCWRDGQNRLI